VGTGHNAVVAFTHAARKALASVLSLAVAGLLVLPPQHLHRARANSDHHVSVVHRHLAFHQPAPHRSASIDHGDDELQWFDDVFIPTSAAVHAPPLARIASEELAAETEQGTRRPVVPASAPRAHGPPLSPPGLRAPPARLFL